MKATDLMIGDWVQVIDAATSTPYYCRVRYTIWPSMENALIGLDNKEIFTQSVPADCLCPIPITPEIFEENGIKLLEVGDNGVATPAKYRNRFEKWEIHTQWKDTYLWYDRQAKYWHLHDMGAARLYYVHELQHALKLCGIDKEITL